MTFSCHINFVEHGLILDNPTLGKQKHDTPLKNATTIPCDQKKAEAIASASLFQQLAN